MLLLGVNHAPSKVVLEQCYALQKGLGMEILLFVCPIDMSKESLTSWFEMAIPNYMKQLNGEYLVMYDQEGMRAYPKESDGVFYIRYKDTTICGKQVPFNRDNILMQKILLQIINEYNPLFVYNMNSINPIGDICGKFTTVAASSMSFGHPVSNADILLCLSNEENNTDKYSVTKNTKQIEVLLKVHFRVDEPDMYYERSFFSIPEEEFVITIIGNRLQAEITDEFMKTLECILTIDEKITILLIDPYPEYKEKFSNAIFEDRIHAIGYQKKLLSVLKTADLYINPPRKGGGLSALNALYAGAPVMTGETETS